MLRHVIRITNTHELTLPLGVNELIKKNFILTNDDSNNDGDYDKIVCSNSIVSVLNIKFNWKPQPDMSNWS